MTEERIINTIINNTKLKKLSKEINWKIKGTTNQINTLPKHFTTNIDRLSPVFIIDATENKISICFSNYTSNLSDSHAAKWIYMHKKFDQQEMDNLIDFAVERLNMQINSMNKQKAFYKNRQLNSGIGNMC